MKILWLGDLIYSLLFLKISQSLLQSPLIPKELCSFKHLLSFLEHSRTKFVTTF